MTDRPCADPTRFDGFAAHIEKHLGLVQYARPATRAGGNRGFMVSLHARADRAMISACTSGVRFQEVDAPLPQELVCSAHPGQEDEAEYLVHVLADRVVRSGRGYDHGDGYLNAEPLIPGSGVEALLVVPHPVTDEEFGVLRDSRGRPCLQFLALVPLTRVEARFVDRHSVDALYDVWEGAGTDLLDVYRASSV